MNITSKTTNITKTDCNNKMAWIFSGLIQSDGSFGISIKRNKSKLSFFITLFLRVELNIKSLPLIKEMQSFFNCGRVFIREGRNTCLFEITDLHSLWHIIIPNFIDYPLYGYKYRSFIKFIKILTLLYPYHNKNKPKLLLAQVIYLGGMINFASKRNLEDLSNYYKILNLTVAEIENSLLTLNLDTLIKSRDPLNVYFIIGLIEGDGSFYIGRGKSKIRFGFSITTHIAELDLLYQLKRIFNCGNVKIKAKNWCRYEVEGSSQLNDIFIPLVNSIGLRGSKSIKFAAFKEAMLIYKKNLTLNR